MKFYRGRFAPSPSGPLHIGSLLTAVGSWCDARSKGGEWLLRIDDLDPPRVRKGAINSILKTLERFGLFWDRDIVYQSRRTEAYTEAMNTLKIARRTYFCTCSRKDIIRNSRFMGIDGPIYSGTCRNTTPEKKPAATRFRLQQDSIKFTDNLQGLIEAKAKTEVGDFVLQRADEVFSYHLANVIDDHSMGITDVIRGADLLPSTLKQICITDALKFHPTNYLHLPLVVNSRGEKLSKQNSDNPVDILAPSPTVWRILNKLNQSPPSELNGCTLADILQWAAHNWDRKLLPPVSKLKL